MPSVSIQDVPARRLAAASATTSRADLGRTIRGLLDQVWPLLRAQGVATGHNVVVYGPSADGMLHIDAGVEIFGDFVPADGVHESETPGGRVATVAHFGAYDQMQAAYAALDEWCQTHSQAERRVQWEVYGDWSDDPAELRTDIYYGLAGP